MKILVGLIFSCTILLAHPHIFVDLHLSYTNKNKELKVIWEIDDMSSLLIYDATQGKTESFLNSGYYTIIKRGNYFIEPFEKIKNFSVNWVDNRIIISFTAYLSSKNLKLFDKESLFSFHKKEFSKNIKSKTNNDYYGYNLKLP